MEKTVEYWRASILHLPSTVAGRVVQHPAHLPALPLLLLLTLLVPRAAGAQALPSGPVSAFDGRLAVGAEVIATIGDRDSSAFFNYTDYEHNVLRMLRVALSASWRPAERLALVAEVRSEDFDGVRPYAAFVRVRPWRARAFDIQAGRIPPVFGSFGRRPYGIDSPAIGYPLAHQYLTALRPDAIPATVDDLLRMRARGWRLSYPVGARAPSPGLPIVSAFRWDTGVQARWREGVFEVAGAITTGTLSDPQVSDNNGGRGLSARASVFPVPGLVLGASAARGAWLDRRVRELLPAGAPTHTQTAFGADAEYSRDYWLVRAELVWSRWRLPFAAMAADADLDALAGWVEGRYRLTPRVFVAGRLDGLTFSTLPAGLGPAVTWDAPVARAEAGLGYYVQRNLVVRAGVQHNDREGGRILRRTYFTGQIAYWF